VRSPRFPKPNLTPLDNTRPAYYADCRYHLNNGTSWRGGCAIYNEINALIASKGGDISKITKGNLLSQALTGEIRAITTEPLRTIDARGGLYWFIHTCYLWPVPTAQQIAFKDRLVALGLMPPIGNEYPLMQDKVYTDAEKEAAGQTWHVTDDMTAAEKAAQEPSCCFFWKVV